MACLNQVLDLGWPRGFCGTDDHMHSNESGFRGKPGLLGIMIRAMSPWAPTIYRVLPAFAYIRS